MDKRKHRGLVNDGKGHKDYIRNLQRNGFKFRPRWRTYWRAFFKREYAELSKGE